MFTNIALASIFLFSDIGYHDPDFDSEFGQHEWLTTLGVGYDLNENIELFARHISQPARREEGTRRGINEIGIKFKWYPGK